MQGISKLPATTKTATDVSSNRDAPDVEVVVKVAHDELPGLGIQ
jgi:hypothetical protein